MWDMFPNPFTRPPSERPNQPNRTLYKNPKVNLAGLRFHRLVAVIPTPPKPGPFGTVVGFSFSAVFKSPETELSVRMRGEMCGDKACLGREFMSMQIVVSGHIAR